MWEKADRLKQLYERKIRETKMAHCNLRGARHTYSVSRFIGKNILLSSPPSSKNLTTPILGQKKILSWGGYGNTILNKLIRMKWLPFDCLLSSWMTSSMRQDIPPGTLPYKSEDGSVTLVFLNRVNTLQFYFTNSKWATSHETCND